MANSPTNIIADAAHVALGFGVLTVNKVQTQRRELTKQIETRVASLRDDFEGMAKQAKGQFESVELPEQVQSAFAKAREVLEDARSSVESLIRKAA